ncbi:hypothetical protein [Shimia sp.]|uniref:hypothetical protein n=1 Tax=Shimia sp. TaxID=1954381 RepID=UPI003BAC67B0
MKRMIIAALAALLACPVAAQTARNCATRDKVVERLAEKYGESRQALGLGAQGAMVEIFASEETGSWTITMTMPNGATCLMATGQAFERLSEALPEQGDDT